MAPSTANYNEHYKLEVQIDVNCSADAFFHMFRHKGEEKIPNCLAHVYQKIELLEGDGVSIGSVKRWHYVLEEGGKCHWAKERMTVADDEKRMMTFCLFEGEVMNDYKLFDIKLAVTPKDKSGDDHSSDVSVVSWSVEYEKAHENAPVPIAYIDCLERVAKDLTAYLQAHPEVAHVPTH